jgi:ATP-dependent DNA helicase RecQ
VLTATPEEILKQYWGYDQFRSNQREIIDHALTGDDVLALLPTGGGKSICYQVPALCMEGMCIVISPLIALMKDQVHQLTKRGIPAAAVFSGMNNRALDIVFENAANGAYKLLYLSPERLQTDLALERIKRMNVNLLAVDEAHCISQWGYDFRPPYLRIAEIREHLPGVPVMALTATATSAVVADIQVRLDFKHESVVRQSFLRSNLSYSVLYEPSKIPKAIEILKRVPGSAVVYSRSRGETKLVAGMLKEAGINADFYHAGLSLDERSQRQEDWINNKTRVIVSTNAFGMGIDKPDVRLVVHLSLPDSLEAYFQEAGRGGRDGNKAYAVLLYDPSDASTLRYQLSVAFPPIETIRKVYNALYNYCQVAIGGGFMASFPFEMAHFTSTYKLDEYLTYSCIRILELDGWCTISESGLARSKAMVLLSSEKSYDYQVRNSRGAAVLQVLLRGYAGVQSDLVDISEQVIGNYAKCTPDEVVKMLKYLHSADIIEYVPRSVQPLITFLRERVPDQNMTPDMELFNFRKNIATEKVERAISYASTLACRNVQLLAYFDEKDTKTCGICDICTGRNKPAGSVAAQVEMSIMCQKVLKLLRKKPLTQDDIIDAWPPQRQDDVVDAIQDLVNLGLVRVEGELVITN